MLTSVITATAACTARGLLAEYTATSANQAFMRCSTPRTCCRYCWKAPPFADAGVACASSMRSIDSLAKVASALRGEILPPTADAARQSMRRRIAQDVSRCARDQVRAQARSRYRTGDCVTAVTPTFSTSTPRKALACSKAVIHASRSSSSPACEMFHACSAFTGRLAVCSAHARSCAHRHAPLDSRETGGIARRAENL